MHISHVLGRIKAILDVFARKRENGDIQRIFVIYRMDERKKKNLKLSYR